MSDYDFRREHKADGKDQQAATQAHPSTAPQVWALCQDCKGKVTDLGYVLVQTHTPERIGRCMLHPYATVCLVNSYINLGRRSQRGGGAE